MLAGVFLSVGTASPISPRKTGVLLPPFGLLVMQVRFLPGARLRLVPVLLREQAKATHYSVDIPGRERVSPVWWRNASYSFHRRHSGLPKS